MEVWFANVIYRKGDFMMRFDVSKVKGLMAENKDNINSLSKVLRIHRNTLSKKLNNERLFTVDELSKMASHYRVEVNIFFKPSGYVS